MNKTFTQRLATMMKHDLLIYLTLMCGKSVIVPHAFKHYRYCVTMCSSDRIAVYKRSSV